MLVNLVDEFDADDCAPRIDQLNFESGADVAHQIVQALRGGAIGGASFDKIILVDHSLGSVAVWQEAIRYGDVDGLIITGAAHSVISQFLAANGFYPAANDPAFAGSGLDPGCLTTVPGIRGRLFYDNLDDDPWELAPMRRRKMSCRQQSWRPGSR